MLAPFVRAKLPMEEGGEAWRWWQQRLWAPSGDTTMPNVAKLEGYDELVSHLLAQVPPSRINHVLAKLPAKARARLQAETLAQLPTEKRLEGLSAEKRLEGLSAEERLAGLSLEAIEAFAARLRTKPSARARAKRRRPKVSR